MQRLEVSGAVRMGR